MVMVAVSSTIITSGSVEVITAVNCSVLSTTESSLIGTPAWAIVSPGANITVIGEDVKSEPAVKML